MPKQAQRAEINAFVKGLVTEASPLNFPKDASVDEANFELNNDGTRQRRLGMDYEDGSNQWTLTAGITYDANNTSTYLWESVNGDAGLDFLVVQSDTVLSFFDIQNTSISGAGFLGQLVPAGMPAGIRYSFAAVDGSLIVVGGVGDVVLVSYDGTFHQTTKRILTRDLWGVEETTDSNFESDPSYRGPLTPQHYYNLQNQSWGIQRRNAGAAVNVYSDPVTIYAGGASNKAPSNSEQVWPGLQFQPGDGTNTNPPFEVMYNNLWYEALGGTTKAAKGYFIIDLLDRSTSRLTAFQANQVKYPALVTTFAPSSDSTLGGASVVVDFSGRIFYAGFNGPLVNGDQRSPILTNHVFFTQLVKSKSDFFKCYQDGDPTSRDQADVLDTDGGFIRISECKRILSMQNLGNSLVVLAENGVWSITGSDISSGFSATNYKVTKISSFGALSASSVVTEGSTCYYWAEDGIYVIGQDQYGNLQVKNVTLSTIQSLYQSIPHEAKQLAFGAYDTFTNEAKWVYKTGTAFTSDSQTFELIFNSGLGAWNKHKISTTPDFNVEMLCPFQCNPFYEIATDETSDVLSVKYLTLVRYPALNNTKFTFSYKNNPIWRDWVKYDGIGTDAKAYVIAGTITAGDTAVTKQIPYLTMHFRRTEQGVDSNFQPLHQSSCLYRIQWDFSNSAISNKWGPLRQAYRYRHAQLVTGLDDTYDNGFDVVTSKNKLRGRGIAFSLYFESEPYKDLNLLGWSLTINGNTTS